MKQSLRVLIVDDEPLARSRLRRQLAGAPGIAIAGECATGEAALKAIRGRDVDLVFLDVQMPDCTGFEVLAALQPDEIPLVVFVTAHDQFALRAFEVQALDYVLKPTRPERVRDAVERARTQAGAAAHPRARILHLLSAIDRQQVGDSATRPHLQRLAVDVGKRTYVVKLVDVDWIEAADNYVRLYALGKSYLHRATLAGMETSLDPAHFVRVHRSAIVNIDRIQELVRDQAGDGKLLLKDGTTLRVSRTFRAELELALGAR